MKTVLITRPKYRAIELAKIIKQEGYKPIISSVLEYKEIKDNYSDINNYEALVFSSPQGVKVFSKNSMVRDKEAITVGDKTAEIAKQNGFDKIISASGDNNDLEKLITNKYKNKRLLHICNEYSEISNLDKKIIYKTVPTNNLSNITKDLIISNKINYITILSRKTGEEFIKILKDNNLLTYSLYTPIICISYNSSIPFRESGFSNIAISSKPDVSSIISTLKNLD